MDVFSALSERSSYSFTQLQAILAAWVLASPFERRRLVSLKDGDVREEDYTKQSIYALLYSLYRVMGSVRSETGESYELTFNTWGYDWPADWGTCPTPTDDPQRFGKNAYTGLYAFPQVKEYLRRIDDRAHVIEMGCGTGAGAHHVLHNVLPKATYEAVDMQLAAIETCRRKFVPTLGGRLVATHSDATQLSERRECADLVAVCETHVTEHAGRVTEEDRRFFDTARRMIKPGGFLVWGNAIPESTWRPCFDYLDSIGMKLVANHDVTKNAVRARDLDAGRVRAYVDDCLDRFAAFRIPVLGKRRREEAKLAMENFYRNPGTNLYNTMIDGTDSYRVVLLQREA